MYDVIIIGSGPAGYTAAIYNSRAFLKTLLIAGPEPGGQLTTTTEIENFPGFPEGILGPKLMEDLKKQAVRFGTEIKNETVLNCSIAPLLKENKGKNTFICRTDAEEYQAKAVIVATGASAKSLGLPSEEIFRGRGISYCATCDGFFFRDKNVAVIGGGDTAMEEANFLTRFASKVTIIHRRDEFRASAIMLDRARQNPKISFLTNKIIEEFEGDTVLKTIKLKDSITGKTEDRSFDGAFVAIGHKPATEFLRGLIEMDSKGYIKNNFQFSITNFQTNYNLQNLNTKSTKKTNYPTMTSVEGVFAAGDCVDPHYRQATVAAGMGCMAAIDVQNYLEEK